MTELRRRQWGQIGRSYATSFFFAFIVTLALKGPLHNPSPLLGTFTFGFPFGTVMTLAHILGVDKLRTRSFLISLVLRGVGYFAVIGVSFAISMWLYLWLQFQVPPLSADIAELMARILFAPFTILCASLTLLVVLAISSGYAISRMMGPGVLGNWVRGYYHNPREEERIFMFLDMKDSTTLAEKLGHLRFSALVRDFFHDLTNPVIETKCEVSHYIGDEAVLTWRMNRGLEKANCVRLFQLMRRQIEGRRDYYLKQYGIVPDFKAGLHCGSVVATEVGEIKSEIVFHGDVLNTAARIQGLCNAFDAELLISEDLAARLVLPADLRTTSLGPQLLKGKEHAVGIFRIDPSSKVPSDATARVEPAPAGTLVR